MSGLDVDLAVERSKEIAERLRASIPHGFAFALFVYRVPPERGDIVVISADRDATRTAVLRWLEHVEAPVPKGRA